jgi:tetratricopeptide (TPR) repeat protein
MLAKLSVDQTIIKAKFHEKKGEFLESQRLYQAVLLAYPKNKRAQEGLAALKKDTINNVKQNPAEEIVNELVNLYNQGDLSVVVDKAQVLTEQYPKAFIVWNILGLATSQIGMLDEAIRAYNQAIKLKPDYADAYINMGVILKAQGKLAQAIEAYKKSITIDPNYVEAFINMGNALQDQGKLDKAIEAYNKAILLKPDYADAYINMGLILHDQGKFDEAIEAYNKALTLKPNYAEAYSNMGNVQKDQGKLNHAISAYKKALTFKSDYAEAYSNMGNALHDQGKSEEAIKSYKQAIKLKPNYAEAHQNLSLTLLQSGRLEEGLAEYEWRWKTEKGLSRQRYFSQPLWDGIKCLKDKRILLWSEQGIGDTMNWSSCLSLVASQAKCCILECQEKLVPLLTRSFPNVEVKAEDRSLDFKRDDFDFHLPMGSLYKHFIEEIIQKTKGNAYLIPDPKRVKFWKERLKSLGKGPYIGICWKSSVVSPSRLQYYPPISEWAPVLKVPDVIFINLQYKNFTDDLAKIQNELGVTVHNFDDLDQYGDIDEVAALCAALDMVVSTKVTPPFISSGVGTSTKIANWRQSSANTILTNPVTLYFEMFHRDTWETWDNVFNSIAKEILQNS